MSLSELLSMWRARQGEEWSASPLRYRDTAEKLLAHGEPLLAYDVTVEGLSKWPGDLRLRQLQALALARSGALERANALLENLDRSGIADEETLGILARTYKDLALRAASGAQRNRFFRFAADTYARAYRNSGGYWTAVNAATMNLLIGEAEVANTLAKEVRKLCQSALRTPGSDHYWVFAALGEAALILQEWSTAEEYYKEATGRAERRLADLSSSRRNARLILQHWNENEIDRYITAPTVIVFAGHMIDAPHRSSPRFPAALETTVANALRERVQQLKPAFGFASAACGADILFLEAMLDAGAEVSIVLPYNVEQFVRDSVDFLPESSWRERFHRMHQAAAHCYIASPHKLELGSVSYEFANELLFGLARIYAERLEAKLIPLAVWDGRTGDGQGGTATAVQMWRWANYVPEIISLPASTSNSAKIERRSERAMEPPDTFRSRIVAILFADAVGFSKLIEHEVPKFVNYFLEPIAELSKKFDGQTLSKNTWGDGLYFVLSDLDSAAIFALEIADLIAATNWQEKGLDKALELRIALHAGPVFQFNDPITGRSSYSGTHVSCAARIEPITPPGHVYASEAFAALASARGHNSFICEYVGQTPLAKEYGTLPMYHTRRRSAASHT